MIKVIGLECSEGDKCECCGASCPRKRVVLQTPEGEVRYGTQCAAYKLLGNRKKGKAIEQMAEEYKRQQKLATPGKWVNHKGETIVEGRYGDMGLRLRYYPGAKFLPS